MNLFGNWFRNFAILVLLVGAVAWDASAKQAQTITNAAGELVMIRLQGAGTLTVALDDPGSTGRGSVKSLALNGVDQGSVLSIQVQKVTDGFLTLENVVSSGPLRNFLAPTAHLSGGSLTITGYVGTITLASVANATVTVTGTAIPAKVSVVRNLTVSGVISNAVCSLNGTVDQVRGNRLVDSVITAGFKPGDPSQPLLGGTFIRSNSIRSVTFNSGNGAANVAFANSLIGADTIGRVSLGSVGTAGNGVGFGLIGREIKSVSVGRPPFRWNPKGPAVQGVDDFVVNQFPGVLPTISILPAAAVTATAATLRGTANPNGFVTTANFEWGTAGAYGNATPAQAIGSGTSAVPLAAALTGLNADTVYRSRLLARNSAGTSRGGDQLFATSTNGVVGVAAGWMHNLALKADGTVWAWGGNFYGQLGNGTTTDAALPVPVSGLSNVLAVASGTYHSLALKTDGTVWTWGRNFAGQLGNGRTDDSPVPVPVGGVSNVVAVAAGAFHTIAVKADGTLWTWGINDTAELGAGVQAIQSTAPVQVQLLKNAAGAAGGIGHTVGLTADGTVWSWGMNTFGELGNGTTNVTTNSTPTRVEGLADGLAVAVGLAHAIVLRVDGTAVAWGQNFNGQLGNGGTDASDFPVPVAGLSGLVTVAAGAGHSIAADTSGTVWTWGLNSSGQLGNGTTDSVVSPAPVNGLSDVVAVAGGAAHTIALRADGTIWTWGSNSNGQLGDGGAEAQSLTPVPVQGLTSGP